MTDYYYIEEKECSRCGNKEILKDNRLCSRCDKVLYGEKK